MTDQQESLKPIPGLEIRYTQLEDNVHLREWLSEPNLTRSFPMYDQLEVDDATARWIGFARYRCSLTATLEGAPCGIATLFLQPYRKLAHQCEFGIVVPQSCRRMGIGTYLVNSLMHLAKERFKIELLHLQVFAGNPAINLYKRLGFREFGAQSHWLKEVNLTEGTTEYVGRVFMERFL